jgi:hypothetical protein
MSRALKYLLAGALFVALGFLEDEYQFLGIGGVWTAIVPFFAAFPLLSYAAIVSLGGVESRRNWLVVTLAQFLFCAWLYHSATTEVQTLSAKGMFEGPMPKSEEARVRRDCSPEALKALFGPAFKETIFANGLALGSVTGEFDKRYNQVVDAEIINYCVHVKYHERVVPRKYRDFLPNMLASYFSMKVQFGRCLPDKMAIAMHNFHMEMLLSHAPEGTAKLFVERLAKADPDPRVRREARLFLEKNYKR